jgi:hypothetical protein
VAVRARFSLGSIVAGGLAAAGLLLVAGCASFPGLSGMGSPDNEQAARTVSRSIWGVVPSAPKRKADLAPELIRGSAVAVSDDTLLADCRAVRDRSRVGLWRHNKYRIARVAGRDPDGQVCALRVAEGPLQAAPAYRALGDLRVGEPVLAFTNETSADLLLTHGWLAATSATPDPFLETTLVLPPGTLSAVVLDAQGNLIGLGSAGAVADAFALAAPVTARLAPQLAQVEIGVSEPVLASLDPEPREASSPPPRPLILPPERDDGGVSLLAVRSFGPAVEAPTVAEEATAGPREPAAEPAPDTAEPSTRPSRSAAALNATRETIRQAGRPAWGASTVRRDEAPERGRGRRGGDDDRAEDEDDARDDRRGQDRGRNRGGSGRDDREDRDDDRGDGRDDDGGRGGGRGDD